mgnify:CR=1 FL=1
MISVLKKISSLLAVMILIFMSCTSFALADDAGMKTDSYDVQVNVKADKSAYITETINADFTSPKHGIYRYIPYRGTMEEKIDGKSEETQYRNKIEDMAVADYTYQTYKKGDNVVVQIGDPDQTVTGKHKYVISYDYRMSEDQSDNSDTLYLNLIPFDWATSIKSADITVNMPKQFDASKLKVYCGSYGKNEKKADYSVKGNTIHIDSPGKLPQGYGITMRLVLPEDYFQGELNYDWTFWIMYGVAAAALILLVLFWFRFGRDPKHVQTVEFEPPEGITPAELGYIIDGVSDRQDLVSLIIYFAHKGYLTIEEADEKGRDFIIRKTRDLPEDSKTYEQTFFNGLFLCGESGKVRISELGEEFYPSFAAARQQLQDEFIKKKENRIFALSSIAARAAAYGVAAAAILVAGLLVCVFAGSFRYMILPAVITGLTLVSYAISCSEYDKKYIRKKTTKTATMLMSFILLAAAMVITFLFIYMNTANMLAPVLLIITEGLGLWATRYMRKRTRHGAEMLGKILGFREFIRVAETDRIKKMAESDPGYFYDILPYAYVLGLSKKWVKKFENIAVEPPSWYYSDYRGQPFTAFVFLSSMNHCTSAFADSIVIPSSSGGGEYSGGSFSGGGFSGGGMGGGGGGSW